MIRVIKMFVPAAASNIFGGGDIMEKCPFCGSEDIYFSKKRKIFVCEDCDETFSEQQMGEAAAADPNYGVSSGCKASGLPQHAFTAAGGGCGS